MKISYLSHSSERCTVQFYGCNFDCTWCFTTEKRHEFVNITPEELHLKIEGLGVREVLLAGGEPTIARDELPSLIELFDERVILSTNGYLLDEEYITGLERSGLDEIHIDLKAYSGSIHERYTKRSNLKVLRAIQLLSKSEIDFEVVTVFIPGVIDLDEVEKIASFLSDLGEIKFRIIRYVPREGLSRRPTEEEMVKAVSVAKGFLGDVTSSLDYRRHPKDGMVVDLL